MTGGDAQPDVAGAIRGGSWLELALALTTSRRGRRAAQAIALGAAAVEMGRKMADKQRERAAYTVSITAGDDLYDLAHAWLFDQVPPADRRSLAAVTGRRGHDLQPVSDRGPEPRRDLLRLFYDGKANQTIHVRGHRIVASIERVDLGSTVTVNADTASWWKPLDRLVFRCPGIAAREAVVDLLRDLATALDVTRAPRFYMARRWGDWQRMTDMQARPIDSVILRSGQMEAIVADLGLFLGAEGDYERVGTPWHRGYILHGPPGTGKTSMARALASHFGLDVYYLALSDMTEDTHLLGLLANIDPRSMVVIEDVDVVHAATSRDDAESKGVSMSGLLNALDGLTTPHGLVVVMTTNKLDALDPALIRPGRADMVEELGYLDDDQASRLASFLAGDRLTMQLPVGEWTHAEMVSTAAQHLHEPDEMIRALVKRFDRQAVA